MFLFKPPLDGCGVERLRGLGSRARWGSCEGYAVSVPTTRNGAEPASPEDSQAP